MCRKLNTGTSLGGCEKAMFVQIEITTHCNYRCFYCAGRDMPQKHMEMTRFVGILDCLPAGKHRVSLQGEGEPTTHPQFWNMVQLVRERGHAPYTITNGSRLEPDRVAEHFPSIGISIDTLDPDEAECIGRYKLAQTLAGLKRFLASYDPARVVIHTVDYGQDLAPVKALVKACRIGRHIIQPLQTKNDYAYRYPGRVRSRDIEDYSCRCRYIEQSRMRYYNIAGIEMPCCFIKDTSHFVSADVIRESLWRHEIPASCRGCREITQRRQTG